jgi:hypothetical protein
MSSRKEIIEALLRETQELRSSMSGNTDASESLRADLDDLHSEITSASNQLASISDRAIMAFSERIDSLRECFDDGSQKISDALIGGQIVGNFFGQAISNAIRNRQNDPRMVMAKKYYSLCHIICDAINVGDRLDYNDFINRLVMHEFDRDQAIYMLDRLMNKYQAIVERTDDDGNVFLWPDLESEIFTQLNDAVNNGRYLYIP